MPVPLTLSLMGLCEEPRAKSSAPFVEEIDVAFEQSLGSHAVVSLTLLIAYV